MKKIPRDIGAAELIKLLGKVYGYKSTRQTGKPYKTYNSITEPTSYHYSES